MMTQKVNVQYTFGGDGSEENLISSSARFDELLAALLNLMHHNENEKPSEANRVFMHIEFHAPPHLLSALKATESKNVVKEAGEIRDV